MKKMRIFISSPGDVKLERGIAKRVVNELSSIYREYIELEILMWEDLPLEATNSFQGGIDYFLKQAPIDIAIFILWSRLGSTLGHTYKREDGSIYDSGTEYEFDTMYTLWLKTQKPKIMVYVKDVDPQFSNGMSSLDIRDALKQQEMLHSFINERFHDAETNTNYAYLQFDKQQTFEERLRTHLSRLIKDEIGQEVYIREWEGNPYIGLKSYSFEESNIYCGRKDLVYEIAEKLMFAESDETRPPLFILGESGSGKSSFIRAGLLPHILHSNNESKEIYIKEMNPSAFHGKIYNSIVDYLVNSFPILKNNPVLEDLYNGIKADYNFKHLKYALETSYDKLQTILFIDQLEEIFNDNSITEEEQNRTFLLLKGLTKIKCIQLILSMRSDFYNRFTRYSDLGFIKNSSIVVDIPKVSFADITEIIEIPAQKANLKWEINDKGVKLCKQIAKDAYTLGQLPLIEFGLSELYNTCKSTEILTYEAYEKIGKLNGAILKYANNLYNSFTDNEKKAFEDLLSAVITISDKDEMLFVRKTSLRRDIEKSKTHKGVLDKLIDAHLFTSGKDLNGDSTITIVHEMLINSWTIVKEWCKSQVDFLKRNDYYEKQTRYWIANDKKDKGLIQGRSLLLEAEYFLYKYENLLTPSTREFLTKSLKKRRRNGLIKHSFIFVGLLFTLLSSCFVVFTNFPIDQDLNEWFGIEEFNMWDIISMGIMILTISGQELWLRISGKPDYLTIKRTSFIWLFIVIFSFIDACYNIIYGVANALAFIVPTIFLIIGLSVWLEYFRRKLWKKSVFKPYIISDRFSVLKNIVINSSFTLLCVILLLCYYGVLDDKNQKLESTIEITDLLFDGLNNISSQLSSSDKIYINDLRQKYISERFPEELLDAIPDDREYQYAICLYNLYDPIASNLCLYYFQDSRGIFLNILNYSMLGQYDIAATFLGHRIEDIWKCSLGNKNVLNLIWIAEKAGRFEIAKRIYNILEDNEIDWKNQGIAYWINYGHIYLMNGDYMIAQKCYDYASEWAQQNNPLLNSQILKNQIENSIKNDFHIFDWLGINPHIVETAMKERNYPRREFYTQINDTTQTRKYQEAVSGTWMLDDSTLVMKYSKELPICHYYKYDINGNESRALTSYRSSYKNGNIYLEELNDETNIISTSEIVFLDEKTLIIRIIENGETMDMGKIRTFTRIEQLYY